MDYVLFYIKIGPGIVIQIRDLMEIFLISILFYYLLIFIYKTRAAQVIKGILALLVAMVIASALGLNILHWILQAILAMVLVAIPIIFQPELRVALADLGQSAFKVGQWMESSRNELIRTIPIIAEAAMELSIRRHGMLLVIRRETGLDEFIRTGVRLDSMVSERMIGAIFWPNSPLHDGAAVIRGDRIVAAGCFVPLSSKGLEDDTLGARHRAALGLSEVSDAVVVIVSEETGTISIASGGTLKTNIQPASLADILFNLCELNERRKKNRNAAYSVPEGRL